MMVNIELRTIRQLTVRLPLKAIPCLLFQRKQTSSSRKTRGKVAEEQAHDLLSCHSPLHLMSARFELRETGIRRGVCFQIRGWDLLHSQSDQRLKDTRKRQDERKPRTRVAFIQITFFFFFPFFLLLLLLLLLWSLDPQLRQLCVAANCFSSPGMS